MAGGKRPVDWHPLAEKDPVPGDPEDIRAEVRDMKETASRLRDQARMLRKVADGDALEGKYADKIREKSGDLEKRFREVAGRYERVVGDLGNWANDLEGFQDRADGILRQAQRADEEHAAEAKKKEQGDDKGKEDTDPDSHLAPYHKRLNDVISDRDTRAQYYANNIGDDISDVIEDSGWEDFKGLVREHADTIDFVVEVMGYVGAALAVIAIFCTPVGWIAGLAIALSVASFLGHTALALAGEGSWTDVALDALGLATMGIGSAAMKGLKAGHAVTKTAAKGAASANKGKQQFDRFKNLRNMLDRNITRYGPDSERGQMAFRAKQRLREQHMGDMRAARRAEADRPMVDAPRGLREKEAANLAEDVKYMKGQYAGNDAVEAGAKESEAAYKKFQISWGIGTGVDLGDKSIDNVTSLIGYDGYEQIKDAPTMEAGSRW